MNWSWTLIFPLIFITLILSKLVLLSIGIKNTVIELSVFYILFKFFLSKMLRFKVSEKHQDLTKFASVIITLVAIFSYLLISVFGRIVRMPFFLVKLLPHSNIWLDHLIISIPTTISYLSSIYIIDNIGVS